MKQKLAVCKSNEDQTLTVIEEKTLLTDLNISEMEVYATYKDKQYKVEGTINLFYIVI